MAPAFKSEEVTVIFVLGGPGAGKGTQCEKLVTQHNFVHLSAGDLLRAEQKREGSTYGDLIAQYIREGEIVPMEITIALLQKAMETNIRESGSKLFLIDGFPRKMDQCIKFEDDVCVSKFTLFFDCPEEVMLTRLLKRGETSGRTDDNIDSIKKRFKTFNEQSMPVIDYMSEHDKVVQIDCRDTPDTVYASVEEQFRARHIF